MTTLVRFNDRLERLEVLCCQALVSALVAVVFFQVLARFVLHWEVLWTLEAAILCFVWTILLGSAIGVRRGLHYTVDLLPRSHPLALAARHAGILILSLVFAVAGTILAASEWKRFSQPSMIRITFFVACIPVMGASSVLFSLERILEDLGRRAGGTGGSVPGDV
jgi:TRAP-type C4-dicarboxylate transport system permease small subunit